MTTGAREAYVVLTSDDKTLVPILKHFISPALTPAFVLFFYSKMYEYSAVRLLFLGQVKME